MEQLNSFNCLSSVKMFFQMALIEHVRNVFNGIEIAFFSKNDTKLPSGWGFSPRPSSVIRLSNISFAHTSLPISAFWLFSYWFKPSPFSKILGRCQVKPRLLISRSTLSLSHKKFFFSNKFDDVIACNLWFGSQSKILATPMPGAEKLFLISSGAGDGAMPG